jgi:Mg2+ and Co2+ transporter CorA
VLQPRADILQDKSSTHTNPFLPSLGEANTKTLQATQKYHDLLTRAIHVLQNNIRLLSILSKESSKRKVLERDCSNYNIEYYNILDTTVEETKEELDGFIKHLTLIQSRLSRITEGIRDSIALRSSHHAAVETQNMRNLTAQSIREARTVKAIALVTLIYLPATFVAVSLVSFLLLDACIGRILLQLQG